MRGTRTRPVPASQRPVLPYRASTGPRARVARRHDMLWIQVDMRGDNLTLHSIVAPSHYTQHHSSRRGCTRRPTTDNPSHPPAARALRKKSLPSLLLHDLALVRPAFFSRRAVLAGPLPSGYEDGRRNVEFPSSSIGVLCASFWRAGAIGLRAEA